MTDTTLQLLQENVEKAKKASKWLERSYHKCEKLEPSASMTEPEFDAFENLTSRFARHSDILFQKVFRSLDQIELEPRGSMLDVLHRAAKRGFFDDKQLVEIKETRNAIAHEYAGDDLVSLFKVVKSHAPSLLTIQINVESYIKKFGI